MRKAVFCWIVLVAAAVSSASAGFLYVPVVDRNGQATEVWLSNGSAQDRRYATTFLPAGSNGAPRTAPSTKASVVAGRTNKLVGLGLPGQPGLLEIETVTQVAVEARIASVSAGVRGYTEVPVISSSNALAAGSVGHLLALSRDGAVSTDLGIVNLATQTAQCQISFFRADGSAVASTITIAVAPLSLRYFADAFNILGATAIAEARAQVSCNQLFYPFATMFNPARALVTFARPAPTGASTLGGPTGNPTDPGAIVFEQTGVVHTPTQGNETRQIVVPVQQALALKRMTVEWDVTPGPWTASKPEGNHNLIWVHRGRFRSNTVANVNTFGPPRSGVKNTQNLDVPPSGITIQEVPMTFQQGVQYHLRYVYDAETNRVTLTVSTGGTVVSTLEMPGTTLNRTLTVPTTGLFIQFGHTAAQALGGIEFPTYGWVYSNLRVEMVPVS